MANNQERVAGGSLAPLRILLLEDSEIDAELIESHLENGAFAFHVRRAENRQDFIDAMADMPDVILADYSLPSFDGLAALHLARQALPNTPFLFVSGVVGEEFATSALQQGAIDYITKRNLRRLPGAVARAVAEARERLERQRAELALRASEVGSRIALSAAKLGSWQHVPETGELVCDLRCMQLFGFSPGEQPEFERLEQRIHPDDVALVRQSFTRAFDPAGAGEYKAEYRVMAPGQAPRWIDAVGQVVRADGKPPRLIGVLRDVTHEKRAAQAMLDQNASLAQSVEQRTEERDRIWAYSHDLLAVASLSGRLRNVNPAWMSLLGYPEDDFVSQSLLHFVHEDDRLALRRARAALQSGISPYRFESRMRHASGDFLWVSWTVVASGDNLYAVGRDVTESKQAADELAEANRRLREQIAEREKAEDTLRRMQRLEAVGQLTSGVAHDFNNLLTVVLGNLGFIERELREKGSTRAVERIGYMRQAAERGAALTSQLLAFSRRQRLAPQALSLNDTVRNMQDLLQTTMGGSVMIETELDDEGWLALVDPTQIELIILNLSINARDAMDVGGTLKIATRNVVLDGKGPVDDLDPGAYVILSVSDTGSGMSEEVLARAMEPFFTTKPVGKGSGLGLAQVYGFAKQSGGGVRIHSALGEGTTIEVYLPRASESERVAERAAPAREETGLRRTDREILLVDDDPAVRDVTAAMLRECGYSVIEAGSGQEALEVIARRNGFDLMILDYAMPGMNGGEVLRAARDRHPGLPAVFVTGFAELEGLRNFPGEKVVQKPFDQDQLLGTVAKVLREL